MTTWSCPDCRGPTIDVSPRHAGWLPATTARRTMAGASMRAFLGCIAAALSVLTFHQGMVALLHGVGMLATAPYQTTPVPPFGVPRIVNLCFWGGLYGIAFGLLLPRLAWPPWLCGLLMGVIAG